MIVKKEELKTLIRVIDNDDKEDNEDVNFILTVLFLLKKECFIMNFVCNYVINYF